MSDQGDRVVWRPLSHVECKQVLYIHLSVRNTLCTPFSSPLVISTSRLLLAEPSGESPIRILYFIYQFTYLLTYSMEQSPSSEANWFCSWSRNSPHFTEPESSLSCSQVPATCPYPEPTPSNPHNPVPLPEGPS
jgi:hypothetical protein